MWYQFSIDIILQCKDFEIIMWQLEW